MRSRRIAVIVVALSGCLVLAGCSGSDDASRPRPSAPTPLAKLDATAVHLARATFCDRVPKAAVRDALDSGTAETSSWKSGDPAPTGGSGDVAHEFGCAWTGKNGAVARAWVFARPVSAELAGSLVTEAGTEQGCTAERATVLGSPALLQTCTQPGGVERVRRAGLFDDTWLTCEVTGPSAQRPRSRLDAWCGAVVAALRLS
jgi:hypothetical protein